MVETRKVSAKSSIGAEYVVNPTASDLRGSQSTKAQKTSAGVSPSFSAGTTTAAAALATISRGAALDDSGSESEEEEEEEEEETPPRRVRVPTESHNSVSTFHPHLKKGKMTLDHMLVIVQCLLGVNFRERSYNATKNKKKLQCAEVDRIYAFGCEHDHELWAQFHTSIKGWVEIVYRIMLACKTALLGDLPVDEEEGGDRSKLQSKIMSHVPSLLVINQTKAEAQALFAWGNWSALLGELKELAESQFKVVEVDLTRDEPPSMYFMPPGAASHEEVDRLEKLKVERKEQELREKKATASVRASKALHGAHHWAKSYAAESAASAATPEPAAPAASPAPAAFPAPASSSSSMFNSCTMGEETAGIDQSAEARSVTPVFEPIVQDNDENLIQSCELAYTNSMFLEQFKDVISRADDAKVALRNLQLEVRTAEFAVESAERQKSSLRSLVQEELSVHLFLENKEDAGRM